MQVEEYSLVKEKAKEELNLLKTALKQNASLAKTAIYQDQRKVYGHMTHGGKVLDVPESFKKIGLNEDGDPKLAICRADAKVCWARKRSDGSIKFQAEHLTYKIVKSNGDIVLPIKTFTWPMEKVKSNWNPNVIIDRMKHGDEIKAPVPIIPANLLSLVKHNLANYHIIWEVEKWEPVPPKDPILLKQLTPNLFAVICTWDLTELERAIIRGRIT
jgi:hypothetical protein